LNEKQTDKIQEARREHKWLFSTRILEIFLCNKLIIIIYDERTYPPEEKRQGRLTKD